MVLSKNRKINSFHFPSSRIRFDRSQYPPMITNALGKTDNIFKSHPVGCGSELAEGREKRQTRRQARKKSSRHLRRNLRLSLVLLPSRYPALGSFIARSQRERLGPYIPASSRRSIAGTTRSRLRRFKPGFGSNPLRILLSFISFGVRTSSRLCPLTGRRYVNHFPN